MAQLIEELRRTATMGDMTKLKALIEALMKDEEDARWVLAGALAQLVANYDYDAINGLLHPDFLYSINATEL